VNAIVSTEIEAYAEAHSIAESATCRALREETCRCMEAPQMMVGPLEGAFLKLMTQTVQAKRILEIGMFTGYSALCFAEALSDDGKIITCEVDQDAAAIARKYFAQSPVGRKIEVKMGPALETMQILSGRFDLIFIDADKQNYCNYFRRALDLLSPAGVILIDNVLWDGDVLRQPPPDERTAAIQEMNQMIASDPKVNAVMITIRDGIFLVKKKEAA